MGIGTMREKMGKDSGVGKEAFKMWESRTCGWDHDGRGVGGGGRVQVCEGGLISRRGDSSGEKGQCMREAKGK